MRCLYYAIITLSGVTDIVTKEQVWKGLKLELTDDEICKIFQADEYEPDNYYDYDLLIETLKKAVNKEIDFTYFIDWNVLVANCFAYIKDDHNAKLKKLYSEVADFFDGMSFMEKYEKKDYKSDVAFLKYYDFLIKKAKKLAKSPFLTNGVERIMLFDHSNWNYDSCVYRVIIKDYNIKQWDIRYVDDHDFDYDESVNYTFVNNKEFTKIFDKFYGDGTKWKEVHNLKF